MKFPPEFTRLLARAMGTTGALHVSSLSSLVMAVAALAVLQT
ncbi:hypothetical protein [Carnobacterium mobile]